MTCSEPFNTVAINNPRDNCSVSINVISVSEYDMISHSVSLINNFGAPPFVKYFPKIDTSCDVLAFDTQGTIDVIIDLVPTI